MRAKKTFLRSIAGWMVQYIPLGRFAPRVFAYYLNVSTYEEIVPKNRCDTCRKWLRYP